MNKRWDEGEKIRGRKGKGNEEEGITKNEREEKRGKKGRKEGTQQKQVNKREGTKERR